jgi:hypothetical protein
MLACVETVEVLGAPRAPGLVQRQACSPVDTSDERRAELGIGRQSSPSPRRVRRAVCVSAKPTPCLLYGR